MLCVVLQDKTISAILPDADTSPAKSALDDDDYDENTSTISDAQTIETIETRDSSNDPTEEIEPETRLKPQETAANDPLIVEVCKDFFFSGSIGILYRATSCSNNPNEQLGCL